MSSERTAYPRGTKNQTTATLLFAVLLNLVLASKSSLGMSSNLFRRFCPRFHSGITTEPESELSL